MLILSRKKDEGIVIDDKIKIYVLSMEEGKVKLGIEAPKTISILRHEVYERVEKTNQASVVDAQAVSALIQEFQKK